MAPKKIYRKRSGVSGGVAREWGGRESGDWWTYEGTELGGADEGGCAHCDSELC